MVSLYELLQRAANQGRAIAAGTVSALATLLSTDRDDLAGESIALLARIAEQPSSAVAILSQPGLFAHLAASSSSQSVNVIEQRDAALCTQFALQERNLLGAIQPATDPYPVEHSPHVVGIRRNAVLELIQD
ncbi:hypothetical protein OsJ_24551 [Oryza sativa Japonica Group]|uniref:Uncharacterized protein n=1 Tax=Oryza sativa subsp. japonica TaxID=39947 RepID=B9FXM4_ORYSJ|nr:hypothetical protein OsJ_24551 [Oryza sativa Japonica Group]